MMRLADYIGEDYTEQKARNFLLHEAIGFLKMLQEEKGNLNNLTGHRKDYWPGKLGHIIAMNKEIDLKFGNPEEEIWELLREEIKKDCDVAVKEVLDEMNPAEKLVYNTWVAMLKGTDKELLDKMIIEEAVSCDKWATEQKIR